MSEETLQQDQNVGIQPSMCSGMPSGISEVLAAVVNLSKGGTYHETTCPFCCSSRRMDAERLWHDMDIMVKNPEDRLVSFFSTSGEVISIDAVRNHVRNHMERGYAELQRVEFLNRIAQLCDVSMTTQEQLKMAMAVVIDCIASSSDVTPGKKMSPAKAQEIKASIVTKLVKTWADLLTMQSKLLGEMEGKGEILKFPASGFHEVFDKALRNAQTEDDKQIIHSILKGLTSLIQQ